MNNITRLKIRSFNHWIEGNTDYKTNDNSYISLPCPAKRCECGDFSKILDNYDLSLRNSLYINMKTKQKENTISLKWGD